MFITVFSGSVSVLSTYQTLKYSLVGVYHLPILGLFFRPTKQFYTMKNEVLNFRNSIENNGF